jgi:hypothetical protein
MIALHEGFPESARRVICDICSLHRSVVAAGAHFVDHAELRVLQSPDFVKLLETLWCDRDGRLAYRLSFRLQVDGPGNSSSFAFGPCRATAGSGRAMRGTGLWFGTKLHPMR